MRQLEHVAVVLLLAAVATVSWVHLRPRILPPPPSMPPDAPAVPKAAEKPREPLPEKTTSIPLKSDAKPELPEGERVREYQAERAAEEAKAQTDVLEGLKERAKGIFRDGGLEGLLREGVEHQNLYISEEDLRALVARFARETDPEALWALAHAIQDAFNTATGTIWCPDQEALNAMAKMATEDADPLRRYWAMDAVGGWKEIARGAMLSDTDLRVRGKAAEMVRPPQRVAEKEALPIVQRYRELLADPSADIRAMAARGFGAWAFRREDEDAILSCATSDVSARVRVAAIEGLRGVESARVRETLVAISRDAAQPAEVREAARASLNGLPIVPEGAGEEIHVLGK